MIYYDSSSNLCCHGYRFSWFKGEAPRENKYLHSPAYTSWKAQDLKNYGNRATVIGPDFMTSWSQPKETS